jgi:hypothetical protein
MQSKSQFFEECAAVIDSYLEFAHALPADISTKVNSLFTQLDQMIEGGSLSADQKSQSFYLKAGLQILKQNKSNAIEAILLKSVVL